MGQVQFGLPLEKPSSQTILPVMIDYTGMCYGLFIIPKTVFQGTETAITIGGHDVPLKSVTRPKNADFGDGYLSNTEQFMAAVWDYTEERKEPWKGWDEWIGPNDTGYYHWFQMPVEAWKERKELGALIGSVTVRMDVVNAPLPSPVPPPPNVTNGKQIWQTSANWDSLKEDCSFFDINWFDKFQSAMVRDPSDPAVVQTVPLKIVVKDIPATGEWKVQVLTGLGGQSYIGVAAPIYNTLRFIKMKPIDLNTTASKDFVFNFTVYDDHNQSTDVEFTLTVTR